MVHLPLTGAGGSCCRLPCLAPTHTLSGMLDLLFLLVPASCQVRVPYTVLDSNGFQATGYINIPLNNPGPLPGPPPPPLLAAPPPPPSTGDPLAATDDIAACQLRQTVDIPVLANDGGSRAVRVVAVSKPAVGRAAVAPGGRSVRYLAPRGGLPASKVSADHQRWSFFSSLLEHQVVAVRPGDALADVLCSAGTDQRAD